MNDPIEVSKTIIEAAKISKEVVPETVEQVDGILATVIGWFNQVILHPVKKANLTYKYKLESFENDLKNKIIQIPVEKQCEPKLYMAGPILEALRYTIDEKELREMYLNLLASSMDIDKAAHPSFANTISLMSPLDAKILEQIAYITKYGQSIIAINPDIFVIREDGNDERIPLGLRSKPKWIPYLEVPLHRQFKIEANGDEISDSIERLASFNLIKCNCGKCVEDGNGGMDEYILFDETGKKEFDFLAIYEELNARLQFFMRSLIEESRVGIEVNYIKSSIVLGEYGRQFINCCVDVGERIKFTIKD